MSSLLLPRHVAAAQRRAAAEAATAQNIVKSHTYELQSDEFVSRAETERQLRQLAEYVAERRETEPDYALPRPSGWKLSVLMLTLPDQSAGGVILVDDAREAKAVSSPQGVILALGEACYTDPARFRVNGELRPWHAVGDRITWVKYDAALYRLANGQLIGFMTDTQPVATIDTGWMVP